MNLVTTLDMRTFTERLLIVKLIRSPETVIDLQKESKRKPLDREFCITLPIKSCPEIP